MSTLQNGLTNLFIDIMHNLHDNINFFLRIKNDAIH